MTSIRIPVEDGYALNGNGLYEVPFMVLNTRTGETFTVTRVERDYIEAERDEHPAVHVLHPDRPAA